MRNFATGFVLMGMTLVLLGGCGRESGPPPAAGAGDVSASAPSDSSGSDDLDALLAQADVERGQTLFLQCRACHSLSAGEPHKVGPNLYGMFGRKAGLAEGFAYSPALEESDVVWDAAALNQWLERPSEFLPGNRMVFIGVKNPADRANLIAYLQQATVAE
jgi:cytochrome c